MAIEKIGEWTKERLNRHIQTTVLATPATLPSSLEGEEVHASEKLKVSGELELSPQAIAQLRVYLGI